MAAKSQDKILCGAALLLLLASAGWTLLQNSKLDALRNSSATTTTPSAYVPAGIDAPRVSTKTWPVAPSQTRGAEWIYDVFTPPEIYYSEATKQFSVTPPVVVVATTEVEAPFGVSLVSVKQDAFRLQLVGYIGGEGDYRGTFEDTISGETGVGRAGKVFPKLGLTIKSFEVKRNKIITKESMPVYDTVATAVVVDTKTGEEITLTNKKRLIKGTPIAVLKVGDAAETIEHKAGGTFTAGDATYTVVSVTAEPPSAEITKNSPSMKAPSTKTLTPAVPVDAVPASPATPEKPAVPASAPTASPFGS